MERVTFISHKGKDIIFTDLSQTASSAQQIDILNQAEKLISTQPPKSVLSLIDYTGARYDLTSVEAQKNFSAAVTPHMKASAVLGIGGLKQVILRSIVRITGRNIKTFDDNEAAKDWLAEQ